MGAPTDRLPVQAVKTRDNPRVTVCMATRNGGDYIGRQLRSILDELEPTDNVIIVDDFSTDNTVSEIVGMGDERIEVVHNLTNIGYVRAFERALRLASGDVVFLADQDDVWIEGRRRELVRALAHHSVVASNVVYFDGSTPRSPILQRPWRLRGTSAAHRRRNRLRILIGIAPYYGCAMAMRREFIAQVLPFPEYLSESHDLWIALSANEFRTLGHVEASTLLRRIHSGNTTPSRPRGIAVVLGARVMLARALWETRARHHRWLKSTSRAMPQR